MCGIAGEIDRRGNPVDSENLLEMISRIEHRGPDSLGVFTDKCAGLSHSRLSIIDIEFGAQPMLSADGNLCIAFNGEIFNFIELREQLRKRGRRFVTDSDTEVILQMYEEEGPSCVSQFNGQWALAIWDKRKRELFLSRDRMGVRPLFYTEADGKFLFASEIKALFARNQVRRELDLEGIDQVFTFWVTIPPRTTFRDIRQLPPGYSMVVTETGSRVFRYWAPQYKPEFGTSEKDKAEELAGLLTDAVTIRLRSDVPVGAYLSGGIDSTVIAALGKQVSGDRLHTFSVEFDELEYDESSYQHLAAEYLHTEHASVRCSRRSIGSLFPEVVWHAEQPLLRTAPAPMFILSKLVRDRGFKVVLTGEGADEVLGGYDIFKEAKIRRFWAANPKSAWRPSLLRRLYPYMKNLQSQPEAYLRKFFAVYDSSVADPVFSHLPRWELTAKLKMFFSEETKARLANSDSYRALRDSLPAQIAKWPKFSQGEYLETTGLLPGYILSAQGDRMAMAHSVEGRYPFLDHRVVEFAMRLPPNMKMKVLNEKYLLKKAFVDRIPKEIVERPKQPYRAPEAASLLAGNDSAIAQLLSPDRVRDDGVFDPKSVTLLFEKAKAGRATGTKDNMALVGVISTQILIDRFIHHSDGEGFDRCSVLKKTCMSTS